MAKVKENFICYFDILGYSNILKKFVEQNNEDMFLKQIQYAMKLSTIFKVIFSNIKNQIKDDIEINLNYKVKCFSDNTVIAIEMNENNEVSFEFFKMLIYAISCIQNNLYLKTKYPVPQLIIKGGITKGISFAIRILFLEVDWLRPIN